ncbi:oxidoreductase [Mycobacterium sp. MS1601]|uniref:SDR family NAD(P)-dependent oxidoreductase n=1 Tax=Mycobacterium sp. MS1601 TaxID=1936029 RepID=UPI00097935AF|nr:SDR family NAD(P)-dependent oxidoreductase [Mycobacterium sp. MS1601]AQA01297.1 oxidoreductase [Mycobacterium sp. MS1601]
MSSHNQHPLGSRFTAASTATDILAGVDLTGIRVVVTGGHAGLGRETTRALATAGATVTAAARNPERAAEALSDDTIEVSRLDLMDPASIDDFAARWLKSDRPLHILINNAGLPAPAEVIRDARGYEAQFATNHLGHFQLTLRLLPALRAARGARVVTVSSGAQRFGQIHWDDPHFNTGYDPNVAYAQSKVANVLFTVELDRRYRADGIRGYAVHPGVVVGTALNSSGGSEQLRAMGLIDEAGNAIIRPETGRKTAAQGASTIVFAAASPLLAGTGGVYLMDNDISPLVDEDVPMTFSPDQPIPAQVAPHAIDPESARRLWQLSEELLKTIQ